MSAPADDDDDHDYRLDGNPALLAAIRLWLHAQRPYYLPPIPTAQNWRDILHNSLNDLGDASAFVLDVGEEMTHAERTAEIAANNRPTVKPTVPAVPAKLMSHSGDQPIKVDGMPTTVCGWLNGRRPITNDMYDFGLGNEPFEVPGLKIMPRPHQKSEVRMIEFLGDRPGRTAFLANGPGMGKTLTATMVATRAIPKAKFCSLIVVLPNTLRQWERELTELYFEDGQAPRILILNDPNATWMTLTEYEIVITTYQSLQRSFTSIQRFKEDVRAYNDRVKVDNRARLLPVRPRASIWSSMLDPKGPSNKKFPWLILDECNVYKNSNSATHRMIVELRKRAIRCLGLAGDVIDNKYTDLFAHGRLIEGTPLNSLHTFMAIFGTLSTGRGTFEPPVEQRARRLKAFLQSFVIRRRPRVLDLKPLIELNPIRFKLDETSALRSRNAISIYHKALHMALEKKIERKRQAAYKHLIVAMQHAQHPMMYEINAFTRKTKRPYEAGEDEDDEDGNDGNVGNDDAEEDEQFKETEEILTDLEAKLKHQMWLKRLAENGNWKSPRVEAILHQFNVIRDADPDATFLVVSESVYFLDILAIAFDKTDAPVDCLRYEGRSSAADRDAFLTEFNDPNNNKVMLLSRSAGGVGLNIQGANNVFLCEPFWKVSWEHHAICRAYRPGQLRTVRVSRFASEAMIETMRRKNAMTKAFHSNYITAAVESTLTERPRFMNKPVY